MKALLYCVLSGAALLLIAWTPIPINDRGTVFHAGATQWVRRDTTYSFHGSRTTVHQTQSRWMVHALKPDSAIETLLIGPLKLADFIPPCLNTDTVAFRIEIAGAHYSECIDSVRDFDYAAGAVSPVIYIPREGVYLHYTERFFYSSTARLQGNGWDDFVPFINDGIEPGRAFVIRIVPERYSGVMIADSPAFFAEYTLSYSSNAAAETEFLDIGDPRITLLTAEAASTYSGIVLRGVWSRVWGTSGRLNVKCYNGTALMEARSLAIPHQERQICGEFAVGLNAALMQEHPKLTIQIIPDFCWGSGEATWRGDSLRLHWQP